MRLAIVGAGPVGLGTAMLAQSSGHASSIWSPSGSVDSRRHSRMRAAGAFEGEFDLTIAADVAAALSGADAIMFAVPANVHHKVIDAVVPHLAAGQIVILWTQSSLSGLYLSKRLAQRELGVPIAMWSVPVIGGRRTADRQIWINTVRPSINVAALPDSASDQVIACCNRLFGERFASCRAIDAALGNVNPVLHVPQTLCNLARVEHGESWSVMGNTTASVARLIDTLDEERRQVAMAFGAQVISLAQFLQQSFPGLPLAGIGEQAPLLAQRLKAGAEGPRSLKTRFIDEDLPYGAVPTEALGQVGGIATPAHRSCIDLFDLLLGRALRRENRMLEELELARRSKDELLSLFAHGW